MKLTIMYNLAIIFEEKGAILDAADLYNEIIEENPHYLGIIKIKKSLTS